MIQTGHAAYPVERTLLTTGILDAVMTARPRRTAASRRRTWTIAYQPTDWPFATGPLPKEVKR